jgi:hypothetical protein
MNKILVSSAKPETIDKKTFFVELGSAADVLAVLRSDHFVQCAIELPQEPNTFQLRFLMHVRRLLTKDVPKPARREMW